MPSPHSVHRNDVVAVGLALIGGALLIFGVASIVQYGIDIDASGAPPGLRGGDLAAVVAGIVAIAVSVGVHLRRGR